jgi:hypothetical protein
VNKTGSGSCPVAGFDISGIGPLGSGVSQNWDSASAAVELRAHVCRTVLQRLSNGGPD